MLDEKGADNAECSRKVVSGWRNYIFLNTKELNLECIRVFHKSMLPILLYGSETVVWIAKYRSKVQAAQGVCVVVCLTQGMNSVVTRCHSKGTLLCLLWRVRRVNLLGCDVLALIGVLRGWFVVGLSFPHSNDMFNRFFVSGVLSRNSKLGKGGRLLFWIYFTNILRIPNKSLVNARVLSLEGARVVNEYMLKVLMYIGETIICNKRNGYKVEYV